jgi:hypothetical protein
MLRPLIHVGLAALLVIAPALCCCNVRLLAGQLAASPMSPMSNASCPACPQPEPAVPSCCHSTKPSPNKSSCHANEPAKSDSDAQKQQKQKVPAAPKHQRCDFCGAKPDATLPKTVPTVDAPEPTGELIPVALLGLTVLPPEHLGLLVGLEHSEQSGVDTRFNSLFARHVLRC